MGSGAGNGAASPPGGRPEERGPDTRSVNAAATRTPRAATAAQSGATCQAPIKIDSSAGKPLKPGRPIEARPARTNTTAAKGSSRASGSEPELSQLPGVGPVIDHPADDGEKQPRDDAVGEHLQDRPATDRRFAAASPSITKPIWLTLE